jgi:hypothetical protein
VNVMLPQSQPSPSAAAPRTRVAGPPAKEVLPCIVDQSNRPGVAGEGDARDQRRPTVPTKKGAAPKDR